MIRTTIVAAFCRLAQRGTITPDKLRDKAGHLDQEAGVIRAKADKAHRLEMERADELDRLAKKLRAAAGWAEYRRKFSKGIG